jgi:hypothetical protein
MVEKHPHHARTRAHTPQLVDGGKAELVVPMSASTRAQMRSYIKVEKYGQLSEPRNPSFRFDHISSKI